MKISEICTVIWKVIHKKLESNFFFLLQWAYETENLSRVQSFVSYTQAGTTSVPCLWPLYKHQEPSILKCFFYKEHKQQNINQALYLWLHVSVRNRHLFCASLNNTMDFHSCFSLPDIKDNVCYQLEKQGNSEYGGCEGLFTYF